MSEKDKRYIDPELEKFFKENKEMIERLFKEEKDRMERLFREEKESFKSAFDEERSRIEELAKEQKKKAKETAQGAFDAFTDPEVQKHFAAMGMEFMMGMNALMKAMPCPDCFRDMADKAEEAKKSASENFSKDSDRKAPEKVEIKSTPRKTSSSKARSSSAKKKTSDEDGI
ncbi:MAG: hypothetical protein LBP82_02760 [Candidatus Methanoplasma sp.]|jgi:hypothetical protein|nr:hypothetical protein [Candidatus Methanoplasma sp.]